MFNIFSFGVNHTSENGFQRQYCQIERNQDRVGQLATHFLFS